MDDGGDKIRTAGIGAGLHQNRVDITLDHTGHQRSQNLAGTVFGGIGKHGKIHIFQQDQTQRKCHNINHTSKSNGFAALEVAQDSQRNIDQQNKEEEVYVFHFQQFFYLILVALLLDLIKYHLLRQLLL